ncbi:MAG: SGNH/GDSL hydrolase family protein, partial [Lutimonas sp.]
MVENKATELKNLKYLALGDSYTIGEGVAEELRWPNQLAKKLEGVTIEIKKVEIIAKTGWTTR